MLALINKIFWAIAISMIFLNAIYFSIKLKFPQLRFKKIFQAIKNKEIKQNISAKDSLIMSLGSKIGAGSVAGIAFAIFYGGIGTIFWIWVSSFLISINCYLENGLAIIYKEKDKEFHKGGPAYYIKKGLNKKRLSIIYSIIAICTYIFGYISIQNNTITTLTTEIYNIDKIIISLIITILTGIVIIKGLKTINNIFKTIVPIMTTLYITMGIIVIILNINIMPTVLLSIIKAAFNNKALTGGIIYTFIIGMQKSIFANEAGLGTSAIMSGSSENNNPKKQGFLGVFENYFITLIITSVTAFIVILSSYNKLNLSNINGIEIAKHAFFEHFGHFGEIMLLIILCLFSISSIIGLYYFGESNLKNLTKKQYLINTLKVITIIIIFFGGISPSVAIWRIVDLLVALLAIINTYAIFKLKVIIIKKLKPN